MADLDDARDLRGSVPDLHPSRSKAVIGIMNITARLPGKAMSEAVFTFDVEHLEIVVRFDDPDERRFYAVEVTITNGLYSESFPRVHRHQVESTIALLFARRALANFENEG